MAPATAASAQTLLHAPPYLSITSTSLLEVLSFASAIATKLPLLRAHCTSALLQAGTPHVLFEVGTSIISDFYRFYTISLPLPDYYSYKRSLFLSVPLALPVLPL